MQAVRQAIRGQVHALVGGRDRAVQAQPRGDDGLFGPNSITWRVHGDFPAMMVGGISALLLQMLHPGALAGVWDHSDFRRDMSGRLKRTAGFISGTTYGTREQALGLIARVRAIHDRVQGTLPNGTPYSANDPALLTFVHVAEMRSFLAAYRRYRDPHLSAAAQDRYFAETAEIARRLGAEDVPTTCRQVDEYFEAVQPALRFDHRTRKVTGALLWQPAPTPFTAPFRSLAMDAGIDLLPDWAAALHGFALTDARRQSVRLGVEGVGAVLRWAL